jgi:transposase
MIRKSNDLGDFMHDDMGFGSAVEQAFSQHRTASKPAPKKAGKFKLYTGPTIVKQTADILRNAGIDVTVEGTEHVHFLADGDRDGVTLQLREILGPQWGVKGVQQLAGKEAANLIHSDSELGQKMELAQQPEHLPGPEAGPSNDELHENTHEESGVPVTDGGIKSPERQNVNAIREAIETQAEMEVGKPIAQKQEEVIRGEEVRDEKLMNPGATEVTAKPGTQIIINVASQSKVAYVSHCPGHRNSKGELAEWCIRQHNTDKIINSFKSEGAAKEGLKNMESHKGSAEKKADAGMKYYRERNGDYLSIDPSTNDYYKQNLGKDHFEGRASAIAGDPSSVCTTGVGRDFLAKKCKEVPRDQVPPEWLRYMEGGEDAALPAHRMQTKGAAGFKQGTRVRISEGTGIDSNKEGVVIPWGSARAKEVEHDYPFVGGRTAQGMGWVCILLDDDQVTTVPKNRAIPTREGSPGLGAPAQHEMFSAQVQAGPIGGEYDDKITSGHGGGAFGGTDLTGPDFHVGFTFRGKPRTRKFTSLKAASAFVEGASEFFGKVVGAWTMKCPRCGGQAYKERPTDSWVCDCGWNSAQDSKKAGAVDSTQKALVLEWLKTNNLTTGEVEKRLGAAPHNTAYPILMELAREGKVKHKQMRWYLKTAEVSATPLPYACYIVDEDGLTEEATNAASVAEAMQFFTSRAIDPADVKARDKGDVSIFTYMRTASVKTADYDGWTDKQTHDLNLYIDQERDTNKIRRDLGKAALEQGWSAEELAERLKKFMRKPYSMVKREFEEAAQETRDDRGAHERRELMGEKLPSTGRHNEDIINQLWDFRHEVGMAEQEQEWTEPNWVEIAQFAIDEAKNDADARLRDMPDKELAGTMGIKMESLRVARVAASLSEMHALRIAIKTLKMPDAMAGVMGGPDKQQALEMLAKHGLRWDERMNMAKKAGEGMAKTEQELEKEAGFNFFFPGQVLKEFYPEMQHEIVDYPNSSNQPMSGAGNPEIVGDAGHELEGVLDSALDTGIVEMIMLPGDVEDPEPMAMAAADYAPTKPGGAMGIGRDGKPEVLEGVPLRKENDIRGEMFTDEFYGQYQGIPGAALNVASKTAAEGDEAAQFSRFLKMVCGEIAATMIAAFKVTSRPLLDKVPGVGELQLDQMEQGNTAQPMGQTTQGGRVKYLMDKLSDSQIQTAVNEAWAQGAVWHDGDNGGFIYEVFVRPETIDTESMKLKYKFVAGTRE